MLLPSILALVVAPQVAPLELVPEHEIGSADGGIEEVFGWISDVATDEDGTVYVLDQRADRVRVFDMSGDYVHTFGRRGRELGDLNRPIEIDVRGGTVTVLNPSGQVNEYSPTGQLLGSERLPFGAQSAARLADERYAVLVEGGIARQNPEPVESLQLVGSGAADTILTAPSRDLLYRAPNATSSIGTSLCGLVHFVATDDALWIASGVDGTLSAWGTADEYQQPIRSAVVAAAAGPLPDSLRARVLEQLPSQIDADSEDLYVPSLLSGICGLERGADGTLWLRLADVDGRERWRAIDTGTTGTTGTLDATRELVAPAGVRMRAFSGGRAYGIRVDDAGVGRVAVYRME